MNLNDFFFPFAMVPLVRQCLGPDLHPSITLHPNSTHGNPVVGTMLGNQCKICEHVWETWLERVPFKGRLEMQSSFKCEYATSAAVTQDGWCEQRSSTPSFARSSC